MYSAYRLRSGISTYAKGRSFTADTVRFSIRELHDGTNQSGRPEVLTLGLMQGGCRVALPSLKRNESYSYIDYFATYKYPILADGYFFDIGPSGRDQAILTWTLEISTDKGSSWTAIGASTWSITADGNVILYPNLPFIYRPAPDQTNRPLNVEVDLRIDFSWVAIHVLLSAVNAFFLMSCAIVGLRGNSEKFDLTFKSWVVAIVSVWVFGASCCDTVFMWREARLLWIQAAGRIIALTLVLMHGSLLLLAMVFPALSDILASFFSYVYCYHGTWHHFAKSVLMSGIGFASLLFAFTMFFNRRRAIVRAQAIVLDDMRKYDRLWVQIAGEPELTALSDMVNRIKRISHISVIPRQYQSNRQCSAEMKWSLSRIFKSSVLFRSSRGIFGAAPTLVPVNSLDQLFVQANLLQPIMRLKVKDWASRSNGFFSSCRDNGFVSFCPESDNHCEIKWAKVKTVSRAIEKVVRVYNQVALKI